MLSNPLALATIAALMASISSPASSDSGSIATPHLLVKFRGVGRSEVEKFVDAATLAKQSITAYLGKGFSRPVRIKINDEHWFPHYDQLNETIIIPANRIRGDAKGPPGLRGRGPTIVFVMTKLIAPSRNQDWGRFLETGLGIYLQEKFGGKEDLSFPNMGRDLHEETARMVANFGRFIPLGEAERERTFTTRFRRPRLLAHLEEGSFVRHLIESKGLTKFLKFYDGSPIEKVYTVDFQSLERGWKRLIRSLNPEAIPRNNVN